MPKKKLQEIDVRAILHFSGLGYSGTELGKLFRVTKSHISRILNNKRWKGLKIKPE
ncbi:hypothetical protein UFOVP434_67 [uncultured Caudovirales phage]|uniref:Uncharacterized protein n=1 Tax=uncultured Caudovirales phage TaxID=2100421 RepID=A0A6J5M8Q6_9CAUD|nr:hypothetical protein UFOVP434_67 [uncultured Caudovirales phage]